MENNEYAVFILTHGRPNKVITYDRLRSQGYTGDIYIIIDNEDEKADEYKAKYGDKVIVFDKPSIARQFDEGDNFEDRRTILHARNASYDIAEQIGIRYFIQLDDDYKAFRYRYDSNLQYCTTKKIKNLDRFFSAVFEFYKSIPAATVAMAQGGDYIGGSESTTGGKKLWLKRKSMNSFFCDTQRRIFFMGRMNEDVNTYVTLGNRGKLFFTFFNTSLEQLETQSNPGGITEAYLKYGTYVKSFYTVMYAPSCVKISTMQSLGTSNGRIHHKIDWDKSVPKIVSESARKSV